MIATGAAMSFTNSLSGMGLEEREAEVDVDALTSRIESIKARLSTDVSSLLESQGVVIIRGSARITGVHAVHVDCADGSQMDLEADDILLPATHFPRECHHHWFWCYRR
jgi:pyruvate/2-oxoglutarate dehydrogenase complex dihydrolipoamide dehydrogenase (E3) component